jgi:maleate isomerase
MYPDARAYPGHRFAVVTAFEAIMATLADLNATRIVLLTPYPADVTNTEATMFSRCGVTVTGSASLGLRDGYDTVSAEQVMTLIHNASRAAMEEAEAVVLSCTGWPTLDLIPNMQRALGKPVISSNLAIGTHAQKKKETHASVLGI